MGSASDVRIGCNAHMGSDLLKATIAPCSPVKIPAFFKSRIIIGDNVGMRATSLACHTTNIQIGDNPMIAPNVIIVYSDSEAPWPPEGRTYRVGYANDRPGIVGRNVWIGMTSPILKGVTIGDRVIVGAGSVVTMAIPGRVVEAGNPARVIRTIQHSAENAVQC